MIYILKSESSHVDSITKGLDGIKVLDFLFIKKVAFEIESSLLYSAKYIILTSKSAVDSIVHSKYSEILLQKEAIVIGEKTALLWRKNGGRVAFSPSCDSGFSFNSTESLAKSILYSKILESNVSKPQVLESLESLESRSLNSHALKPLQSYKRDSKDSKNSKDFKKPKILYLCGMEHLTVLKEILKNHCDLHEIIVYESVENRALLDNIKLTLKGVESSFKNLDGKDSKDYKDSKDLEGIDSKTSIFPPHCIFIFGSPKIYRIFRKNFVSDNKEWDNTWSAISLGDSTFKAFDKDIKKFNARGNFESALHLAISLRDTKCKKCE